MPVVAGFNCCPIWYCVDGVLVEQLPGAAPTGTVVLGPWATEAEAIAAGCAHSVVADVELTAVDPVDECCDPVPTVPGEVWLNFDLKTGFAAGFPNSVAMPFNSFDNTSKRWNYTPFEQLFEATLMITTLWAECEGAGWRIYLNQAAFVGGTLVWSGMSSPWSSPGAYAIQDFACGAGWELTTPEVVGTFTASGGVPTGSYRLTLSR